MPTSAAIISNTAGKEYFIERMSNDNLDDLSLLHKEVYGAPRPVHYFSKKYDTAYTGVKNVGFIAYNKQGHPVAYYGVIPCFIKWKDAIILAAQSADTMTHPGHRNKGLFAELSGMTFDLCKRSGIRVLFGFPNQNFYRAVINKPGWTTIETMEYFTIPVKPLSLPFYFQKMGILRRQYFRFRSFILKKYLVSETGIPNSVLAEGFAGVYRNNHYLNYKTYNFSKVIAINDSKIWINDSYGLAIGDIDGITEDNFAPVIDQLKKIAGRLGVNQIQFHCSPGTTLHRLFAINYEPNPSFHIIFQDFGSTIPIEKIKFTFADIDIF